MTETPVKYGDHVPAPIGTPCEVCGAVRKTADRRPATDHCWAHGWVRGVLCGRCNSYMALIDRRIAPDTDLLPVLIEYARRCPDCPVFSLEDLASLQGRVSFLAKLPEDLRHWLRVTAAREGIGMNDLVILSLEEQRRYRNQAEETRRGIGDAKDAEGFPITVKSPLEG
jgi:Recombination endonuclease VII